MNDPHPHRCRSYRQGASRDGYVRPFRCLRDEGHDGRCEFGQ